MSLLTQSQMSEDLPLMRRIAACAASEGITEYATTWAARNLWLLAATPGWDDRYATALTAGTSIPGADESVITDDMIRDAVRALIAASAPEPEPISEPDPEPVTGTEPEEA